MGEEGLSYLMKIVIESPKHLSDDDLENIFAIMDKKT